MAISAFTGRDFDHQRRLMYFNDPEWVDIETLNGIINSQISLKNCMVFQKNYQPCKKHVHIYFVGSCCLCKTAL